MLLPIHFKLFLKIQPAVEISYESANFNPALARWTIGIDK